ncbi:MAG: DNA polymerase III subunit chi [Pseudomonadota bacterium]|nr:DNA polymerase III subunit chi [Pseudomonadota bacterium]
MTRIDFYVARDGSPDLLVCRIVEKALCLGHQTCILTTDAQQSARLDALLWTFSPGSFVPHRLHSGTDDPAPDVPTVVLIGHEEPPVVCNDVLVSLRAEVPGCFSRFQRVIEFVGTEQQEKQQARIRYRFYRDRGYPLEDHSV